MFKRWFSHDIFFAVFYRHKHRHIWTQLPWYMLRYVMEILASFPSLLLSIQVCVCSLKLLFLLSLAVVKCQALSEHCAGLRGRPCIFKHFSAPCSLEKWMLKAAVYTTQSRINTELRDIAAKAAVTSNNLLQHLYVEQALTVDLHFSLCLSHLRL